MPGSVLVNGIHYYMRQKLAAGDRLRVCICETECSGKIPPVKLPLDSVYEDEDIIVGNASISTIECDRETGRFTLVELNDRRHLEG